MLFYLACILSGYLIHRMTKSKWGYLLAPVGAFFASMVSLLAVYLIAPTMGYEIDGKAIALKVIVESGWGTLWVAASIWYFRRKKMKDELDKVHIHDPNLPS